LFAVGITVEALGICLFLFSLVPRIEEVVVAENPSNLWRGTESFRFIFSNTLGLGYISLLMVIAAIWVYLKWKNSSATLVLGGLFLLQLTGLVWFYYAMISSVFGGGGGIF
jgi:hypothetical protein